MVKRTKTVEVEYEFDILDELGNMENSEIIDEIVAIDKSMMDWEFSVALHCALLRTTFELSDEINKGFIDQSQIEEFYDLLKAIKKRVKKAL